MENDSLKFQITEDDNKNYHRCDPVSFFIVREAHATIGKPLDKSHQPESE